ncbi:PREDICTED: P protein-like, partial [Amphimedon queenslandica]|uniref:Citrate transporter-like domain-containing protein n=2 Tax=Amphimedon queenslandica TaxID=400682 RepID=A0AAN0ISL1_AMPQE
IRSSIDLWKKNLEDLESRYKITDRFLLFKSTVVLIVVILMFFFSHFIPGVELNLGWIAIFGALMLLILADIQELEAILNKVEWGTLLFFAGLFVLMEGLAELGLMEFIGRITVDIIKQVDEDKQLLVAIVLVLWVSAIASSFIDNIPFTQAM